MNKNQYLNDVLKSNSLNHIENSSLLESYRDKRDQVKEYKERYEATANRLDGYKEASNEAIHTICSVSN